MRAFRGKIRLAAVIGVGSLLVSAGQGSAAGGYGPFTPPTVPGGPAAFEGAVRSAKTVGRAGGRLSAALAHSARVTVVVERGTFAGPEQVAIEAPSLRQLQQALRRLHDPGYTAATGLALLIAAPDGKPYTHRLARPIAVVLRGTDLDTGVERVISLSSSTRAVALDSKKARHELSLSVRKEADLMVIGRVSSRARAG